MKLQSRPGIRASYGGSFCERSLVVIAILAAETTGSGRMITRRDGLRLSRRRTHMAAAVWGS